MLIHLPWYVRYYILYDLHNVCMGTYYHRHCLNTIICKPAVVTCTHAKCRSHAFPFHRSEADRLRYTYRFQTHIQFQDTLKPYYQHQ